MTCGELFAGIGGMGLGLEWAGMRVRWQVEKDPWCRGRLSVHWPEVERHELVEDVGAHNLEPVDLVCGGFPCQPVSGAGKKLAEADERWLWPHFERVVRELRPSFALVENVPGLLVRGMGTVLGDLAALGYDAEWDCIPAAAVGAPHLRYRVFIVASPRPAPWIGSVLRLADTGRLDGFRRTDVRPAARGPDGPGRGWEHGELEGESRPVSDGCGARGRGDRADVDNAPGSGPQGAGLRSTREPNGEPESRRLPSDPGWWSAEPGVGRVAHGVPARVDRLRALGNAVVPQVAEWIGRRLMEETT